MTAVTPSSDADHKNCMAISVARTCLALLLSKDVLF